jgi:hypothetical protein
MSMLSTTRQTGALRPARPGVPWGTVLTLAVALSCTTAFWLVSLQGAIGAPERARTAFTTWLLLSLAVLPVFMLAVLGALTLAMRRFGTVLRGLRPVVATAVLLVVLATLAGLGAIVVSSAYDYALQLGHVESSQGMSPCTGSCVPREQHAILVLHVRGVLLIGRLLLLTNVVLVAWLVAMWGGRIKVAALRGVDTDGGSADVPNPVDRLAKDVRLLLAGALVGAALIHLAVVPEHLEEWPTAGRFFVALTAMEIAVAVLLLIRPGRLVLLLTAAISVAPLTAWLWSRTLGLPFGPEPGVAEAVGVPDVIACVLEVGALLAAVALLYPGRFVRSVPSLHARACAALALVAVTTIGVAATGQPWFDAFGVAASQVGTESSH